MTYGWAILVVVAAIVALLYFDVLNPGKYAPDTCVMHDTSIGCIDHNYDGSDINVVLRNNVGETINNVTVTMEWNNGANSDECSPSDTSLTKEQQVTFACNGTFTDRVDGSLTVNFTKSSSSLAHTKTGDLGLKVS